MSAPGYTFLTHDFVIQAEPVAPDPGATTDWTPGIILVVAIFCVVMYWTHGRRRGKKADEAGDVARPREPNT